MLILKIYIIRHNPLNYELSLIKDNPAKRGQNEAASKANERDATNRLLI